MPSTTSLQLERIRRRTGVSLDQIADRTKISTRFLRAIETEEFEKLPGGVFDTNYIRQYAAEISFPSEAVLAEYHQHQRAKMEEEGAADATIVKARNRWGCRWLNWLRSPSAVARS